MKNKKLVIILTSMMVLIGGILYVNQIYNKSKNKHIPKRNNLAIMIKEDGATDYTKSNSKDIPKGDYTLNYEKSYCKNNGVIGDYDSTLGKVSFSFVGTDSCFLYFDYKESTELYKIIQKRYNSGNAYVGLYDGEDSDIYENKVYYYKDNVENNNVLFAGFCWKIVRTTETGGVKLIYNGVQKIDVQIDNVEQSSYVNISNDATYPYTFDSTNKTWTSTNHIDSSTGTITFTVATAGDYYLNYTVSSESNCDKANFYKNGTAILSAVSGEKTGSIELTGLTTSDVIKVEYTKDTSSSSGSDNVVFSIGKAVGDPVKSCNNTGTYSQIGKSAFNSSYNSPAYVGYMYNTVYPVADKSMSSQSNIVFGNSFTYVNGAYTLTNTKTVATWSSGYNTINSNHYTCLSTGTTCSSIYYVYDTGSTYARYITLTGGKSVDDALNEMLYNDDVNTKNSTIKTYIDNWYSNNMTSYTNMLEDTVFCNDRSMNNKTSNGWYPNGGSTSIELYFKGYDTNNTSLKCTNENDKFTVNSSNGNGKLTYPVGLLTVPEAKLANYQDNNYLFTGEHFWLGSPGYLYNEGASVGSMDDEYQYNTYYHVSNRNDVHPSVSLKSKTIISSGDGSYTSPFLID